MSGSEAKVAMRRAAELALRDGVSQLTRNRVLATIDRSTDDPESLARSIQRIKVLLQLFVDEKVAASLSDELAHMVELHTTSPANLTG